MTFLFATAIETGYPLLPGGHRIDQMDRCGHYARWEEDFEIVRELGLRALRYGPAYYRTHLAPDRMDWQPCDEPMHRLRDLGVEVIADLCHFGVPSWLGGFQDPAFPVLFASYARAFATRYPWVRHFTPIAEIVHTARRSALTGEWNECEASDGAFVRAMRNLCLAHELAVEAILAVRGDAIIVQSETLEPLRSPDTAARGPERSAALRYLALDLTLGHELAPGIGAYLQTHGVTSNELSFLRERRAPGQRWIGLNSHAADRPRASGTTSANPRAAPSAAPNAAPSAEGCSRASASAANAGEFGRIAAECFGRYRTALFLAATNRTGADAARGLDAQWRELRALRASGILVAGFTWSSLTDTIGWEHGPSIDDNTVHDVGLCDLNRELRPVGEAYALLARASGALASRPAGGGAGTARPISA